MIQGFKRMLAQADSIIEENWSEQNIDNPNFSTPDKIQTIALKSFRCNLQLIIFQLEARELSNIEIRCAVATQEQIRSKNFPEPTNFDDFDFSDFGLSELIEMVEAIQITLKRTHLSEEKLRSLIVDKAKKPKEILLTTHLLAVFELLENIIQNNALFHAVYKKIKMKSLTPEELMFIISEGLS